MDDEPDVDENDLKSIEAAEKRAEERAGLSRNWTMLPYCLCPLMSVSLAAQRERMKRLFGDDEDSDDDSFYDRTGAGEYINFYFCRSR